MVEVHPVVLIAFGAVAAGLTAIAIFRNKPAPVKGKTPLQPTVATSGPTKKKKTKAKKEPGPIAVQNKKDPAVASVQPVVSSQEEEENDEDSDEELPIPVPKSKSNGRKEVANNQRTKAAVQPAGPTAVEKAAAEKAKEASERLSKQLEEEQKKAAVAAAIAEKERMQREAAAAAKAAADAAAEEEKKKKAKEAAPVKPKETPQQREARVERQRISKAAKKQEDPVANRETAVAVVIPADTDAPVSSASAAADSAGKPELWAVVEDKRKTKTKKTEPDQSSSSAATSSSATSASSTAAATSSMATSTNNTASSSAAATTTVVAEVPSDPVDFVKSMVPVDAKKLGAIIGAKGVNLKAIQEATGAEIQAPKGERDATATTAMVTVTGTADAVAKATRAIKDLVTKGYSKLIAGEDFQESSVTVHPMYLAEIIGKGGCNIRAIQDATGVKLNIPQVARDHALPVKVTLAGSKDKVAQAKAIVTELTQYYRSSVTHPTAVHLEMDIPSNYYNYIIGARGSEIKHIQGNFKVSVHIPNADTINKNVVIVGENTGVKNAEKYIQKIIDGVVKDKEEAERLQDSWVDPSGDDSPQEEWMDQYTHPSRRSQLNASNGNGSLSPSRSNENVEHDANAGAGGGPGTPVTLKTGEKSNAAAANAAAAWGASVLASAEGW